MENSRRYLFLSLIFIFMMNSCASRKDVIYLQDIESTTSDSEKNKIESIAFEPPVIKKDDRLTINISSINAEAAKPFNLFVTSYNTEGVRATNTPLQQSYLVDQNGDISFPELGKISVKGKTRIELESFLEKKIKPYLPDAKATVQIVNFRISVLGEVFKPGEFIVNREKINILQALGLAGDLKIHGKRDNIKVVRQVDGELTCYTLDIRSKNMFQSPAFYLQQNDVVYVAPNKPQVNASASSPTASYIISATGLLITIISILTR